MDYPTTLSKKATRKLRSTIREYSKRLGLKDVGDRFSARQHIIRVCHRFPEIAAYVRPGGGKLTSEQCARFFRYMVEHPIGDFSVSHRCLNGKLPKENPKIIKRKRAKVSTAAKKVRADFYKTWDWRQLRYQVLKECGARCGVCGATRDDVNINGDQVKIVVDHIKPLYTHWHLRLEKQNLQVLCDECNMGKGAWDTTDWRSRFESANNIISR